MITCDYEEMGWVALGHSELWSLSNMSTVAFFCPELLENGKAGDLQQCHRAVIEDA